MYCMCYIYIYIYTHTCASLRISICISVYPNICIIRIYHICNYIHPCKITYTSKDRKKTSLNMAPAVRGFILTWKKSLPHGFSICFYVKVWGSHVGKVNWIAPKSQKMNDLHISIQNNSIYSYLKIAKIVIFEVDLDHPAPETPPN